MKRKDCFCRFDYTYSAHSLVEEGNSWSNFDTPCFLESLYLIVELKALLHQLFSLVVSDLNQLLLVERLCLVYVRAGRGQTSPLVLFVVFMLLLRGGIHLFFYASR